MTCKNCTCGSKTKKQLRNNVALVLDDSGSMSSLARTAQTVFNQWVKDIQREAISKNQSTNVSLVYFGEGAQIKFAHQSADKMTPINDYRPMQGSTSLFSGVKMAIETLDEVMPLKKYDDSYLVLVVTDGEENSSGQSVISRAVEMIKDKQGEGTWTFVFVVPPGQQRRFCSAYNIPKDNVLEWEQTERGMQEASIHTSAGISGYYTARSTGAKSVASFFVQPDLSKVRPTEIKRKLDDVSPYCQQFTVAKEEVIKDFIERKTKKAYVLGTTYYQLMKTEKVQAGKGVLLVEKGKSQIWSGDEARNLIGLPAHADAKVEPGNHANYDIFVQSTSVNRKLPRGTKVIVVDHIVHR